MAGDKILEVDNDDFDLDSQLVLDSINRRMEQSLVNGFNNMNIEELLHLVEPPALQIDNKNGKQQLMGDPEVLYDDDDVI